MQTEETLALLLQVLHNWLCKPQNTLATVSLILLFFLWNGIKHQPHGPIGVYIYAPKTLLCQKKIAGCIQQQAVPTCGQRWTKSITANGIEDAPSIWHTSSSVQIYNGLGYHPAMLLDTKMNLLLPVATPTKRTVFLQLFNSSTLLHTRCLLYYLSGKNNVWVSTYLISDLRWKCRQDPTVQVTL